MSINTIHMPENDIQWWPVDKCLLFYSMCLSIIIINAIQYNTANVNIKY